MVKALAKLPRLRMFEWFHVGPAEPDLVDRADTSTGALWTTLRQDRPGLALLLLTVVALAVQVTLAATQPAALAARLFPCVPLALAAGALRIGRSRIIHQDERRLWDEIAVALLLRAVATLVLEAAPISRFFALFADTLFTVSFLALVIAVERPMQRRAGLHSADLGRALTWPGGSIFAFGLAVYFCLVPASVNPPVYATRLPAVFMFVVFEFYVTTKLAYFAESSESQRWRMLYSLLGLGVFALLVKDVAEGFLVAGNQILTLRVAAAAFTVLALLLVALAARLRHHAFPSEEPLFDSVSRKDPLPWPHGNMVVFALAFPLIHLLFHRLGLLDEPSKGVREAFVLVWLFLFGAMALTQQRMLEKRARSLWLERMRAEDALHKSNETLRLVNERTRAEEALRTSEEKFLKAFRAIPDSMVISTLAEGRIREVNDSFSRYFGYQREEVLGKTGLELDLWVELEDRAMMTSILRERGMVRNFEFEFYSKTGERRVALLSGEIIDIDGETCLLMVLRDITERQVQEEKIHEQAALLDAARDAIMVRDLEGRIIFWNKSAERLYGWTAAEVLGRSVDEKLQPIHHAELERIHREVLRRGEWSGDLRQVNRDGAPLLVESRWTLVKDPRKGPLSQLVINTDVTDRKRLEERLARVERLESIGMLSSGIAHDLNNVLTPITMTAETLSEAPLGERYEPLVQSLLKNARRGSDMVRQVLTFAGQDESERVSFQPKHLVHDMERVARESFPAEIELTVSIPKDPWTVYGHPGPLHQVLRNLCINARDAIGDQPGKLRIELENIWMDKFYARRHVDAKEGPYVVITVSDSGPGIPPEIQEKVFDPFFSTKTGVPGAGLGLALDLGIVRANGGFMTLYSEPGSGTSFQIFMPSTAAREGSVAKSAPILPGGNGECILVVDDDASIRDIIEQTLEAFGYRVVTASNGAEAVNVYESRHPNIDLVLLDMMMPVMDGNATAHALKNVRSDVAIIAVSGLTSRERMEELPNVRAALEKPYTAEKLLTTLRDVLGE